MAEQKAETAVKVENPPEQKNQNMGGNQQENQGGGHPQKGHFQHRGGRGGGRFMGPRGGGRGGGRFGGPGGPGGPGGEMNQMNFQGPNKGRPDFQRKRGPPDENRGDRNNFDERQERGPGMFRGPQDKFQEKLHSIGGPTFDLPPIPIGEKKFNGRNRLYVGNIGNEVTEQDLTDLFKQFGETSEVFLNKEKNFAFIKLDFHSNAEKAKRELDGTILKSRNLKIRFAPNSATIKIKNLHHMVSNELLQYAFGIFGEIEKATVSVDERGRPTGEGIVDFARKGSALAAIRKCQEGCFFLTGSLRPCIVEAFEIVDDNDGYPDKNINKKHPEFNKERDIGPRFAAAGSFEHEYGTRWKNLHDLFQQKELALKKEFDLEKEKLEAQMEYARYEHETEMLREQLRTRELDRDRQKREWEMKERQAEEQRQRTEEQMRRQQEDMESRMLVQEEELRRRQQENNLFMQAHNLDSLLEQEEQQYEQPKNYNSQNDMGGVVDPKSFMSSYERNHNRFDGRDNSNHPRGGQNNMGRGGSRWVNDNRHDEFQNKRRRF